MAEGRQAHVRRKASRRRNHMRAIKKRVKNIIRIINLLQTRNGLKRRTENQGGQQDRDTVMRFLLLDVLPDGFFGFGFGYAVGVVGVLSFDCVVD